MARLRADLTQKALAEKADVAVRSLINWEQGGEPSQEALRKICNALHVDFAYFYTEEQSTDERMNESAPEGEATLWKRRAVNAEKSLNDLRTALRSILEMSSPTPTEKPIVSSEAEPIVSKESVEDALDERRGKVGRHRQT